jgi:hypothetical protein
MYISVLESFSVNHAVARIKRRWNIKIYYVRLQLELSLVWLDALTHNTSDIIHPLRRASYLILLSRGKWNIHEYQMGKFLLFCTMKAVHGAGGRRAENMEKVAKKMNRGCMFFAQYATLPFDSISLEEIHFSW